MTTSTTGSSTSPLSRRTASPPTADPVPLPLVRAARPDEADWAAALLASGFHDDAVARWLIPDEQERRATLPAFFRVYVDLALTFGDAHIARDADGHGAVLLAHSPEGVLDADRDRHWEQRHRDALGGHFANLTVIASALHAARPRDRGPFVYISFVTTDVKYRRTMLASRVLATVVDRWAREGVGAYGEASSPAGAVLAGRAGFRPIGERVRLPDGPTLLPMFRKSTAGPLRST